jgi:imidazolonepropionase-like amidohydrolase
MGVKIAAGSDAYMPWVRHGELAYELEEYVKVGLSPMEAIVAATETGAEVLGIGEEAGTIEEGKLADLIVVDGDPLADIRVLQDKRRIERVIKGGKVVVSRS